MKKTATLMLLLGFATGAGLSAQDVLPRDSRTWQDASGQFSIEAVLIDVRGDQVVLQRPDKTEISIALDKLSETDRQYVQVEAKRKIVSITPSQDLVAAVQQAAPNTTIVLQPGSYRLNPRPPYQQAVLIENKQNLVLTSRNAAKTRIELSADTRFGFYIGSHVSDLTIKNLTLLGTPSATPNTIAIGNYSGSTEVRRVQFRGLRVENVTVGISACTQQQGVYHDVVIRGNQVKGTLGSEAGSGYGIHLENAGNVTVSENVIENATRHSIYVARAAPGSKTRIENNLVINHDLKGKNSRWYSAAIVCSRSSDVTIAHNLIVDPRAIAISVERDEILGHPTKDNQLINNRIIGAHYVGIWVVTGNPCLGLGNNISLTPKPVHPQWCHKVSFFDFPRGKPTKSSLVEPNARWKQASHVVELGDQLLVMANGVLDRVIPGSWDHQSCPRRWEDVRGMVGLPNPEDKSKGLVYIVTGTGLHEVNPETWKVRSSPGDWDNASFVTAAAGYIHLLQGDLLYRIHPRSLGSTPKTARWPATRWMYSIGQQLYLASPQGRFQVDPLTLEAVPVDIRDKPR